MVVQIVNKLNELYCIKADNIQQKLLQSLYGITCYIDNANISSDIDIKKDILEYYNQFSESQFECEILTNKCLKKLING